MAKATTLYYRPGGGGDEEGRLVAWYDEADWRRDVASATGGVECSTAAADLPEGTVALRARPSEPDDAFNPGWVATHQARTYVEALARIKAAAEDVLRRAAGAP